MHSLHVLFIRGASIEFLLRAVLALERSITAVPPFMINKVTLRNESSLAVPALIRSFSCMSSHVECEIVLLCKGLSTSLLLASKHLLLNLVQWKLWKYMFPLMNVQSGLAPISLATVLKLALKLDGCIMWTLMGLQLFFAGKSLLATFVVALKPSLGVLRFLILKERIHVIINAALDPSCFLSQRILSSQNKGMESGECCLASLHIR